MPQRIRAALPTTSIEQSRRLRSDATDAENELWYHFPGRRMHGAKFRRQHPVPPYIADFYCPAACLVIEVDGSQHGGGADLVRTAFLEKMGLRVMRFDSKDVFARKDDVLEAIWNAVAALAPHPNPSPDGRGAMPPR